MKLSLQNDGVAACCMLFFLICSSQSFAQAARIDSSFGKNGRAVIRTPYYSNAFAGAALTADQKIVVGGERINGNYPENSAFFLSRLNEDGTTDVSFGNNGQVITVPQQALSRVTGLNQQTDGKILLAGDHEESSYQGYTMVLRYNTDGSIDNSYGIKGKATVKYNTGFFVHASAIQHDNKTILGGWYYGINYDAVFCRLTADGKLDSTFGTNGFTRITDSLDDSYLAFLYVAPDGKIVYGGKDVRSSIHGGGFTYYLGRLLPDGTPDSSFNDDGIVYNLPYISDFRAAVQADGKIVLTAAVNGATSVARYTSSGEPDASFGANGITTFPVNENLNFETLTILQDGSIIIAGSNSIYYADHYDVLKFTANGKLDSAFNAGNPLQVYFKAPQGGAAQKILIDNKDRIVVAGMGNNQPFAPNNYVFNYALSRITTAMQTVPNLVYFCGIKAGKTVALNWSVANPKSLSYFVVERSTDGMHYTAIDTVKATKKVYAYADINASQQEASVLYYRLSIMAKNNSLAYSKILSFKMMDVMIAANESETDIKAPATMVKVTPNPVVSTATIRYSSTIDQRVSVLLLSEGGQLLKTVNARAVTGINIFTMDLETVPQGIYFIKINAAVAATVKVIKQ